MTSEIYMFLKNSANYQRLLKFQDKDVLARKTPLEFNTSAQLGKIRPGFSSICLMLNIEYFLLLFSAGTMGKAKQKFDI